MVAHEREADGSGPPVELDRTELELHYECVSFYNREAELLDDRRLRDWLDVLTEDVTYEMPVRVTRNRTSERPEFSDDAYTYHETRRTLEARVERFESEYAWSEEPPSRVRRFVSNVRVKDVDGDELSVRNNLLVTRGQGDTVEVEQLTAERADVLRRVDGELELAARRVLPDHTILPMRNVSIFL